MQLIAAQDLVSLQALGSFVAVVLAAVGGFLIKKKGEAVGREQADRERGVLIDGQPLTFEMSPETVTKEEMRELEQRLVVELKKLEAALSDERGVARVANGKLHARIDRTVENLSEMRGELRQINNNLERLLNIAMHSVNPTPKKS